MITNFLMSNDTLFIQQFHSTVQVELLNETAIKRYKLAHGTLLIFLRYYKNANQLKKQFAPHACKLLIAANRFIKNSQRMHTVITYYF